MEEIKEKSAKKAGQHALDRNSIGTADAHH